MFLKNVFFTVVLLVALNGAQRPGCPPLPPPTIHGIIPFTFDFACHDWNHYKIRMELFLDVEGLLYIINGEVPMQSEKTDKWTKDDKRCKHLLVQHIDNKCLYLLHGETHAKGFWNATKSFAENYICI